MVDVKVMTNILAANDAIAEENRKLFKDAGVLALNLMSGPGAGKTSLLERTLKALEGEMKFGIVEGDIATSRDAERLEKYGVPIVQINTQSECHLDANMVHGAVKDFPLDGLDVLIIENVGNLVCPAEFIVGEDHKVMLLSVTEGDEKPLKYPLMFHESSLLMINKTDLLPYVDFDMEAAKKNAIQVSPNIEVLSLSCKTEDGLDSWFDWLRARRVK